MTLSVWRPLKDAPRDKPVVINYDGFTRVAQYHYGEGWGYWSRGWVTVYEESGATFVPIADTYELDRAVQGEIVRAFTVILSVLVDDERMRIGAARRGKPGECFQLFGGYILREAASILHTAMGGRIPDEVPHA